MGLTGASRGGARELHKFSKIGLGSVLLLGLITLLTACFEAGNEKGTKTQLYGNSMGDIVEGMTDMVLPFCGIGLWPYIVAEMLNPQNASSVVQRASVLASSFYLVVAAICYAGWGGIL